MRYKTARPLRPGKHFWRDVVCESAVEETHIRRHIDEHGLVPTGTTMEHPAAWKKVRIGDAYPADEECRIRAGMSDREIQQRIDHQTKSLEKLRRYLDGLADAAEDQDEPDGITEEDDE